MRKRTVTAVASREGFHAQGVPGSKGLGSHGLDHDFCEFKDELNNAFHDGHLSP